MPAPPCPSRPRLPRRPGLLAATALLALAGCGSKEDDKFAPPCPTPFVLREAGDLHRYRGAGRDLTDAVLEGRVVSVNGTCKADGPGIVVATMNVGIDLARGPAANSRVADVSYFITVSQNERVLDKQVFRLAAEFPPNTDRLRLRGDDVDLRLPITATRSAAAYRIYVGFQLTPSELEVNRQRGGR